jgi:hypothetical protein
VKKVDSKTRETEDERVPFHKAVVTNRLFMNKEQSSRGRRILLYRFLIQIGQDGWLFYVVSSEMR